ncbi:MAG: signal recognition particle receptor subunit alpha, partial [Candidatus Micrarchaeota archaeon]
MFGQLKAKLSGFVDRLIGREEKKERAALPPETPVPQPKPADEEKPRPVFEESIARPKPAEEKAPILGKSEPAAQARPARTPEKKVENELQSLIEEKKGTTLQKEVGKKPQPFIGEKKEPAPAKADSPVVIAKEPPAPAPPPPKTIGSSPPKKLPVSAAPEPVPSQKPSVSAASEPKKDFLSSIWPFQKPKEEKKEAPPVLAPGPQEAAPKIPSGQKAPAQSAHENLREPTPVPPAAPLEPKDLERLGKKALFEQEREMKIKLGLGKNLATLFSGSITITEEDVRDLIDDLELSLLESDVAYEVSLEVAAN